VFQNESYYHNTLFETEKALAGQLTDGFGTPVTTNYANPSATGAALAVGVQAGPLLRFEIESFINLSQFGGELNGNFPDDAQMPGIPGINNYDDGIDAEITTFVEFPAGLITLGVNSDDGFRMQAGFIKVPSDGVLLGEYDGVRTAGDTRFPVFVRDAGIYPLRTIWQEGTGSANIELFSVKPDGTPALINDTANGGLKSYRSGVAPDKPPPGLSIRHVGNNVELNWLPPGLILQHSDNLSIWQDLPNAVAPYVTPAIGRKYYRLKP
jgi:hypothetical protein